MNKSLLKATALMCLLCSSTFAAYIPSLQNRVESAGNWYGSFFGGGVLFENINLLDNAGVADPVRLKYEFGYGVGGALGYRIIPYNLRFEAQYTYSRLKIDLGDEIVVTGAPVESTVSVDRTDLSGTPVEPAMVTQTVTTTMTDGFGGHSIMHSPFFNALYDFSEIGDRGHPYVGVGVGYQRLSFNIVRTQSVSVRTQRDGAAAIPVEDDPDTADVDESLTSVPALDPSDTSVSTVTKSSFVTRPGRFAYQVIAGLMFESDGDLSVDISYRYIMFKRLSSTIDGVKYTPRRAHSVHMATIGFTFPLNQYGI